MPVIFHSHLTESVDPVVDFTVDPSKTVWIDSAPCLPRRPNPTLHWVRNVRTWPSNICRFRCDGVSWKRCSIDRHEFP